MSVWPKVLSGFACNQINEISSSFFIHRLSYCRKAKLNLFPTYLIPEAWAQYAVDERVDGAVEHEEEVGGVVEDVHPQRKGLAAGAATDLGLLADKDLVQTQKDPREVGHQEEDHDPHEDHRQVVLVSKVIFESISPLVKCQISIYWKYNFSNRIHNFYLCLWCQIAKQYKKSLI